MQKVILFVGIGFPSQFHSVVKTLKKNKEKYRLIAVSHFKTFECPEDEIGIEHISNLSFTNENPLRNSQCFLDIFLQLKKNNIIPDLIFTHAGTGIDKTLPIVFPHTPIIGYYEWFFRYDIALHTMDNIDFLSRSIDIERYMNECALCLTPTVFQKSQFPLHLKRKLIVLHEGINCDFFKPKSLSQKILTKHKFTVTYLSRGLEPIRCFMEFIEIAKIILLKRKDIFFRIVGDDNFYYEPNPNKVSFKKNAIEFLGNELLKNVEFLGKIPINQVVEFFQQSDLHIYISRNFVPSWSLLEAMSVGVPTLAPIGLGDEFIQNYKNGYLVDTRNIESSLDVKKAISEKIEEILSRDNSQIRINARQTVIQNYNQEIQKIKWVQIVDSFLK